MMNTRNCWSGFDFRIFGQTRTVLGMIKEDLAEVKKKYGDPRRTEISQEVSVLMWKILSMIMKWLLPYQTGAILKTTRYLDPNVVGARV